MTLYTRIGACLWNWEPWLALDDGPRNLWLALYTTAEAKRIIPGLWHGSINQMAEASRRSFTDTWKNLDKLLEAEMVEFDQKHRVLRMTMLPDAGEYPASPTILASWWSKFLLVPTCLVRDAHVGIIRWILDTGAKQVKKNRSGRPTPAHEEMWEETFGTIAPVAARRRGIRRLSDQANDTSTDVQPSLFASPSQPLPVASSQFVDTVSIPSPSSLFSSGPTSDSANPENNPFAPLDTVSRRYGEGEGVGVGVSGSGDSDPAPSPQVVDPDPGRRPIENAIRRPTLALVPAPRDEQRCTPEQLVAGICAGFGPNAGPRVAQIAPEALSPALCETIRALDERGWGTADLALAGKWLATRDGRQALAAGSHGCPPGHVVANWAADAAALIRAIQRQAEIDHTARARAEYLQQLTGTGTGPP